MFTSIFSGRTCGFFCVNPSHFSRQMMELPENEDFNYTDNFDYNDSWVSPCSHQNNQSVEQVVGPYVRSLICILGLVGNSLVIVTYAFYKRTKSMTDVFLLNVAVADLLFVAALPLIAYNEAWAWPMGAIACKMLRGSYSVNLYSGMLLLACVSADRYVAIVQARRSFRLRSPARSRLICAAVWVSALLLSVPTFYSYNWYRKSEFDINVMLDDEENPNETQSDEYMCEFQILDRHLAQATKVAIPSMQLTVGFFLPLLVMIFCYSAIAVTLLRARNFQRHRAVRVVLVVVAVFVCCHMPYNLTLLYDTITMFYLQTCRTSDAVMVTKTLTQTAAHLHCCLNPLLYAFVGAKFRSHFKRIVCDLCCLGRKSWVSRRNSRVTSEAFLSSRRSMDGSSSQGSSFTM